MLIFLKIIEEWNYCQFKYDELKKLIEKKISKYDMWFLFSKYYVTRRFSKWILIYNTNAWAISINIIRFVQILSVKEFVKRLEKVNRRVIESNWNKWSCVFRNEVETWDASIQTKSRVRNSRSIVSAHQWRRSTNLNSSSFKNASFERERRRKEKKIDFIQRRKEWNSNSEYID